jgi:hypothetical protein
VRFRDKTNEERPCVAIQKSLHGLQCFRSLQGRWLTETHVDWRVPVATPVHSQYAPA